MKHFTQPKNTILREIHHSPSSTTSTSDTASTPNSTRQLRSATTHTRRHILSNLENTNPNSISPYIFSKIKSPLPPRPPNPHKRKLLEVVPENRVPAFDSGVQVIVRVKPPIKEEEGDMFVQKVSNDSLSINGQNFTFDYVADIESTQLDIFQLVGAPLVENCLAGFNSSVFAYGQTGSGKTYTIWGPANALLEKNLLSDQQGLTPRVFDRLFSRIKEEQIKHADKQLEYQCLCSFLEIYNEQITDLLDPGQKNLHIREDVKSGVYVENLTEVTVYTMKDVTQLLIKGFSNRRIGATSINAESSRSHSVFTCVVESRGKSTADGVSSFKTSRINLVDLAGSERQKLTRAAGDRLKEAGNINRSLSQLGNLINILADVSQTGKQRHIPYRDSRLTFLLQESLGGNAKLAMICAISPSQSCKSESFSTLRFAQRAKAIKNKAVVNEVMQDDVNVLRKVIRGLKDELIRMKGKVNSTDSDGGYSTGWNARRSLNLLRFSLHHPIGLVRVDDDGDTEMEIVEEAVEKNCLESNDVAFSEGNLGGTQLNTTTTNPINEQISGVVMQVDKHETMDFGSEKSNRNDPEFSKENVRNLCIQMEGDQEEDRAKVILTENNGEQHSKGTKLVITSNYNLQSVESLYKQTCTSPSVNEIFIVDSSNYSSPGLNLSTVPCVAPVKTPVQSGSPKVNYSRKSQRISLNSSASNAMAAVKESHSSPAPTEHLAASLHRGLEIIVSHRQSSPLRQSPYRSPLKPSDYEPNLVVDKVNVGVQTVPQHNEMLADDSVAFLCSNCKCTTSPLKLRDTNENSDQQLVPVNGTESADKIKSRVPKAVEKVLAGAIRREMALEEFCSKQTAEVMQLNRLVQQYKHERECNVVIGQIREDKIARLERLMDGVLPTDEFMEEEFISLTNEHTLLKEKYENHPEILSSKIELKRVQEELESYKNFHDMGEKDVLLEEIQDLRTQLQYYMDSSPKSAKKGRPQPLSTIQDSNLAEQLKIELKASRSKANKLKQELDSEKKCAEELKEAMQIAMEGSARMLEQYADLQEKHLTLLATQRKIHEGIDDVKTAAVKAGVRSAESKFINALAAEISALKVEREKERQYFRDENKELRAQLRDTADAVQTAGELIVRLKEAEEAVSAAQNRAREAEEAYKQIDKVKKKHGSEMNDFGQCFSEHHLPEESMKYDQVGEGDDGLQWREEFAPYCNVDEVGDMSKLAESGSWFSGYDRCNI